jgi:magnesium-transporting ATPase (P-type)
VSIENEAWAKGWPDYVRENKNKTNKMNIKEYSKKFNWLGTWSKNHLLKILEIILPYIIFLFFLFFYFFKIKKRGGNDKNFADNLNIYILLFLLIISTLAWFIKIPTFRYGYSYPISFISIVFGFMGVRYFDIRDNILKKYLIFLILCFTVLFSKNLIRINGNLNYYTNYPWPKFYSMSEIENKFPELTEINISDKKFYRPSKNNYCMYYKSPCIHYGNYLNAKIVYKNSYTIVYVD